MQEKTEINRILGQDDEAGGGGHNIFLDLWETPHIRRGKSEKSNAARMRFGATSIPVQLERC